MKVKNPILLTALLVGWLSTHAATYYVSSISGNDSYTSTQAQSQATPWKTLSQGQFLFQQPESRGSGVIAGRECLYGAACS
jgi:hypothetical protein